MASQAQILANRRNAQKSTGPRTDEGKATAAKNGTKHGLFARDSVVISENQAVFDALHEEMLAELKPVGAMEAILAERIVSLTWRLKRAARMQDEVLDVKIRSEINSSKPLLSKSLITGQPCRLSKNTKRCYDDLALGLIAKWDFEADRVLERLSMYERRFEASLFKTMGELKKLQQLRKSEQAKAKTVESAIPPLWEAATHRGRDAHETQGRDALATTRDTAGNTECVKQSQSAAGQEELSAFEKREYELLISTPSVSNKANDLHRTAGTRGRETANRPRRQVRICRY